MKEGLLRERVRYQQSHYGPDADLFLNSSIANFIKIPTSSSKNSVLDVGGGCWPASILTIQIAKLCIHATYSSKSAVTQAEKKAKKAGLEQQIKLVKTDTDFSKIRSQKEFHKITSINQGNNMSNKELVKHLSEIKKALTEEGFVLFTAPTNLGEVFTTGNLNPLQLKNALSRYNMQVSPELKMSEQVAQRFLGGLYDIHRATFVQKQNKIMLVTKNKMVLPQMAEETISIDKLQEGEVILRKTPNSVVRNVFHTQDGYKKAIKSTGLTIIKESAEGFKSNEERKQHNNSNKKQPHKLLGPEYVNNGPFLIAVLKKG